jgi:CBS domain-containing protein
VTTSTSPNPTPWRDELARHAPFTHMRQTSIEALLHDAKELRFAAGATVMQPADGVVGRLLWVRSGTISARRAAEPERPGFQVDPGDLVPIGAVVGARAVTSVYRAIDEVTCLAFDADLVRRLLSDDPALADFMNRRVQRFLEFASRPAPSPGATSWLAQQSLDAALATLPRREPVTVGPDDALAEGLRRMHDRKVGSVVVVDPQGRALGILTRHDLLERVALRQPAADIRALPMRAVMSQPVHTLELDARLHDAALLMSRHGMRHVPLTDGRVVGIVSERDLFALQRVSLRSLSVALRDAPDVDPVVALAPSVRAFARQLAAQGMGARALTALVSQLNDTLVERVVQLVAARRGLSLTRAAWLAFGSEGRGEQTIATDQDNGLVLVDDCDRAERERWLALGVEVNRALDAAGYPLCKGGVMAGNEACCLRQSEWLERFEHWMARGEPEDLLQASIYFDVRALTGQTSLAAPLRRLVTEKAASHPRFIRLLAENSLRLKPALNWHGGIDAKHEDGGAWVDLKMNGTAAFVDAARLIALAEGVDEVSTLARLEHAGARLGAGSDERSSWASAFELLQTLRLRVQMDEAVAPENPNRLDIRKIGDFDRRLLKEALRVARRLQQRIELEWLR